MFQLPKCYHCGEIYPACFFCEECGEYYCDLHKEPAVHECDLVKEESILTQQCGLLPRQGLPAHITNYEMRGRTDGTYTWYRHNPINLQEESIEEESLKMKLKEVSGTICLFCVIILFSLLTLDLFSRAYICLSAYGVLNRYFWTFFTSLFVVTIDGGAGILFFLIGLFFMFKIAGDMEREYSFKFLLSLYCFCGLFSGMVYLIIRFIFSIIIPIFILDMFIFSVGVSWGSFLGLIAYKIFLKPDGEWSLYIYGLPIKLKGKSLLLILVLLRLFSGIYYGYFHILTIWTYFFELSGFLAGYIIFRFKK